MVLNLLKQDIKKTTRVLVYIYAISIILAGITRFINIWSNIQFVFIIGQVFAGITYSAIGSIIVNTFVHILRNFINSFYKDESYLTHTLPVKKSELLLSKYISSVIVVIASVVVSVLSLFIIFYSKELMNSLKVMLEVVVSGFDMSVGLFLTLVGLIIFAEILSIMNMSFAAIVKANTYNHKRVGKGLLWLAIFYIVSMIVSLIAIVIVCAITGNLSALTASVLSQSAFLIILIVGLVAYLGISVFFYFLCLRWFNKGVNVD